ncbi:hypothetical protein [Pseudoneobacillus sp. C159]
MKIYIILIEILLICFLVFRLYKLYKCYIELGEVGGFIEKIEIVLKKTFPTPVALMITREMTMLYYLFARKSNGGADGQAYTYHKSVGYKGVLIALLSVILLESVGLFFLLHKWSLILSWIHIALNIYGVLYLISDYRAIVQRPIFIKQEILHIKIGTRREISIPYDQIASITSGSNYEKHKRDKNVFKGLLIEFDTPQFELNLKEPINIINFLGKNQAIQKVYLTVDEKGQFYQTLLRKMER